MNCTECGAENLTGSATCWKCGHNMLEPTNRPKSRGVIIAVVLVALAAIIFMVVGSGGPSGGGGAPDLGATATGTVPATRTPDATSSPTGTVVPAKEDKKGDSSP